ncbi:PKD domain-containing protein [Flagellimonas taeanensis]|nr:PKD domain-containing protein [Allomuricauda taeanensis]
MDMKTIKIMMALCSLAVLFSCTDDDTSTLVKQVDADFSAEVQNVQAGNSVQFTDLSIGDVTRWDWTFPGGTPPTSNLQSPEVVYETPGTYNVTLKVANQNGNKSITKEGFIVVKSPEVVADFELSANSVIMGNNFTIMDKSTGDPTSWQWEFIPETGSSITSTDQNPTIVFEEPGVYSIKLTAANADYSDEVVMSNALTVLDLTSVDANFEASASYTYTGNEVTFTDLSVGNVDTYSWTFEGGTPATSNQTSPAVTYADPGRYRVSLTVSNDNGGESTITKEDYIVVVPGGDLAAYFPLKNGGADAGPNTLSTNIVGNVLFTGEDRFGNIGTATFDGASLITVADNDALNFGTDNFSVGVWVKTENTSRMMIWQESGANGPNDNQTWLRIGDNTDSRVIRFDTEDNNGGAIINIGTDRVPNGLSDGLWHFVVAVRDGNTNYVYVDGLLIHQMDVTPIRNVSNEQDFKIGGQEMDPGVFGNFLNGTLDGMLIYNKALTQVEITELYNL